MKLTYAHHVRLRIRTNGREFANDKTKTTIIAELANAHQGSVERAKQITIDASENGAENIKYQIYTADELLNKKHKKIRSFQQATI